MMDVRSFGAGVAVGLVSPFVTTVALLAWRDHRRPPRRAVPVRVPDGRECDELGGPDDNPTRVVAAPGYLFTYDDPDPEVWTEDPDE